MVRGASLSGGARRKGFRAKASRNAGVRALQWGDFKPTVPEDYERFMITNTIGFLGIKQYALERDGDSGKVWGEPLGDLLSSVIKFPTQRH